MVEVTAFRRADGNGSRTSQLKKISAYMSKYLKYCDRMNIHGALVFDIDDTIVTENGNKTVRLDEIASIYDKYKHVFPTYLVTARREAGRNYTQNMLHKLGLDGYKELHLCPPEHEYDPGVFKWNMRRAIKKRHGKVLVACGDQPWDALPWPVPAHSRDLMRDGPSKGALVQCTPKSEVGVLLPSQY